MPTKSPSPPFVSSAVRVLQPGDAEAFRALRLEAVLSFGEVFANYYENMIERPAEFWRTFCTETENQCLFGFFDDGKLVGIVGVEKWGRDPTGETALWTYAYVQPAYRNKKLAKSIYEAREEWMRHHPRYKRAVLSILKESARSREIHEKQGARYICTEEISWYGGIPAPWDWYEKRFSAAAELPVSIWQKAVSYP